MSLRSTPPWLAKILEQAPKDYAVVYGRYLGIISGPFVYSTEARWEILRALIDDYVTEVRPDA